MWFADYDSSGKVSEFDATTGTAGTAVSSTGYSAGGVAYPLRLAVDQGNHIWVANFGASASTSPGTTVSELSNAGVAMGNSPFSLGTLSYGYAPFGIAVDGGNHIWTANASTYGVSELDDSGNVLSPNYGFIGTVASPAAAAMVFPEAVAIDEAGNVWVANFGYTGSPAVAASITELVGAGTPTLTPIEAATIAGTPAAKP
jgi:DNA-binding beta-propeller fold protein YncE